jgi:hypothetical protein
MKPNKGAIVCTIESTLIYVVPTPTYCRNEKDGSDGLFCKAAQQIIVMPLKIKEKGPQSLICLLNLSICLFVNLFIKW